MLLRTSTVLTYKFYYVLLTFTFARTSMCTLLELVRVDYSKVSLILCLCMSTVLVHLLSTCYHFDVMLYQRLKRPSHLPTESARARERERDRERQRDPHPSPSPSTHTVQPIPIQTHDTHSPLFPKEQKSVLGRKPYSSTISKRGGNLARKIFFIKGFGSS